VAYFLFDHPVDYIIFNNIVYCVIQTIATLQLQNIFYAVNVIAECKFVFIRR